METEIWKEIKDFEEYKVSNFGRVKSKHNYIYKPQIGRKGYLIVTLHVKRKGEYISKTKRIHRLVAEAFILNDDPINKFQVNHKNGIKSDNNVNNLEWCTNEYNMQHAIENSLVNYVRGEDISTSILSNEQVKDIYTSESPTEDIALRYNVSPVTIGNIRYNKNWTHITKDLKQPKYKSNYYLDEKTIKEIYLSSSDYNELKDKYNISKAIISKIKNGLVHSEITQKLGKQTIRKKKAKLNEKQVCEIYLSNKTTKELAAEYGVGESTIYFITSDRNWTHITKGLIKHAK